jgi:hypothetical protein
MELKWRPLIIVALLIIFITILILFFSMEKDPVVALYKVEMNQYSPILEFLKDEDNGLGEDLKIYTFQSESDLLEQFDKSQAEILISRRFSLNAEWIKRLDFINSSFIERFPRSSRASVQYEESYYSIPLQLDMIELAYMKNQIENDPDTGLIFNFNELENQFLALKSSRNYPLMISGANDQDLLDALSVLSLSLCGVEGYEKLYRAFQGDDPLTEILSIPLGNSYTFETVIKKLKEWEDRGILHPEWTRFTRDDAITFLEDGLSNAYIMRLSTHRTLDDKLLSQMGETPFPYLLREDRATGILAPMDIMAVNKNSKYLKQIESLLPGLIDNEIQERITSISGLAPATSISEALDKQASNARLWAAASQTLLEPLSSNNPERIREIREYLVQ